METELRACLSRRASLTPPPTDLVADAVLARARVVRRRQAGVSALALVLVATVATVVLVQPWPAGTPVTTPPVAAADQPSTVPATEPTAVPRTEAPAAGPDTAPLPGTVRRDLVMDRKLPVDVIVADQLLTVAGARVELAAVGGVVEAYQVSGGWLVLSGAAAGAASLWYVAVDGEPRALLAEAARIVVAPTGDRVAWRAGARVHVGALTRGQLEPVGDLRAQAGVVPVAFVGKGLLLARKPTEAITGSYAVWWPGRDDPELRWRVTTGVYGALPDDRTVVAQVAGPEGDQPCLALLDAFTELDVRALACDVPMTAGAVGSISPDGRWLVAERTAAESVFVDVESAFRDREPAVGAGPRPNGPGAWMDARTVVYGGAGCLARLRLDLAAAGRAGAVERIAVRGGSHQPVLAVPRLAG